MNRKTLLTTAVSACFDVADAKGKATDAARALFAGVGAAKRDEVKKEWYDAIREKAGLKDGKPIPSRELPENVKRAYGAAREAFRALFGSGAKKGKAKGKARKAIVIPLNLKGMTAMSKAAQKAIQKAEDLPFDAARAMAAWAALEDAYKPLPKE